MFWGSNPSGGEIFRTYPDWPWSPPIPLYNGYRVFPWVKAAEAWRWPPTPYLALPLEVRKCSAAQGPHSEVVPRAFWRLVSESCDECKGSFARGCEAKRWSHWTCSSLGTIFQPMRINSVPVVECFCNNKNVLRAQTMVWHFVRHSVYSNIILSHIYTFLNTLMLLYTTINYIMFNPVIILMPVISLHEPEGTILDSLLYLSLHGY